MKRILISLLLVVFSATTAGCFKVRVVSSTRPAAMQRQKQIKWHFLAGLTPAEVQAIECRDGLSSVEVKHPWWSWGLVVPLTFGLVAASKVQYTCADDKS